MNKKKSYVAAPRVSEAIQERYRAVLQVLSGEISVSEAARQTGLSRNHFQTLMHRGLEGLIAELTPKAPGRPRAQDPGLLEKNERLEKEVKRLQGRVEMIDRMLGVASDLLKGRAPLGRPRQKKTASTKSKTPTPDDEEPRRRLQEAVRMRQQGLSESLAAKAVGESPATLRRWRRRQREGQLLRRRRGPSRGDPPIESIEKLRALVTETHALPGAVSLSRSVPGVSRRQAAAIKREVVTQRERQRREACHRVKVTAPGIIRGFDQLCLPRLFALIAADAAVPYRTGFLLTPRYDGPAVARMLQRDFDLNGAPLVLRADRARSHRTPQVEKILRDYDVLLLQGPARYPRFYGQLERQNLEHRAFLRDVPAGKHALELERMIDALNSLWRRPNLSYRTASELWNQRPSLDVDRKDLRLDVNERAARIARHLDPRARDAGLHERLAIEQALTSRGLLRCTPGGWC